MANYTAPVTDMMFVLEHIAGLAELATFDRFADAELDVVRDLLDEAGKFMSAELAPLNETGDREGLRYDDGRIHHPDGFAEAYGKFAASGWNGMGFPPEFGGGGMPWCVGLAVQEMLTAANMAFSLCPLLTQGAVDALLHHADEELAATYLEKMISGEWSGTMNLTEPHAGSDVGALTTKAEPQPDGSYRIFGTKIFITYGEHELADNIIHLVLARTPGAPVGTRGISLFLVPKFIVNADGSLGDRNDLKAVSTEHKIGIHASPTCVMSYGDDGAGAVGYMVGPECGGMRAMFTMMNNARLSVGLQGLSLTSRAYQQARDYALERKQGKALGAELESGESSPIVDHADVRRMLMTMRANEEAMRGLMYANAAALDRRVGESGEAAEAADMLASLLTPVAKGWGTDVGVEMTSLGVQVHGGMGYVEETGAAQHWRDIRIAPIYEGTNGIQAADLAFRKLPLAGGDVVAGYVGTMGELAGDLASRQSGGDEALSVIGRQLSDAVGVLTEAATYVGKQLTADLNDVAAASSPLLRIFGVVAGGYYLALGAKAAATLLAETDGAGTADYGADFLADKITTARFYAEHILPTAAGHLSATIAGANDLFAIDASRL